MDADYLLINNNNTRTKFALATGRELLAHEACLTSELSTYSIGQLTGGWSFEKVVIASVVPSCIAELSEAFRDYPLLQIGHDIDLGVLVDFPDPTTVGADRLANAAAVAADCTEQPAIVVDFGTAVTFDIVDTRPAYIGGVIAPGLDSMTHYLHQRTALLPQIEIAEPDGPIGKSTVHAMQSGAYHGYRGLVIEIITQIEQQLGAKAQVIATGGYAELLSRDLAVIDRVETYLTMAGLRQIAARNFEEN